MFILFFFHMETWANSIAFALSIFLSTRKCDVIRKLGKLFQKEGEMFWSGFERRKRGRVWKPSIHWSIHPCTVSSQPAIFFSSSSSSSCSHYFRFQTTLVVCCVCGSSLRRSRGIRRITKAGHWLHPHFEKRHQKSERKDKVLKKPWILSWLFFVWKPYFKKESCFYAIVGKKMRITSEEYSSTRARIESNRREEEERKWNEPHTKGLTMRRQWRLRMMFNILFLPLPLSLSLSLSLSDQISNCL